MNQITDRNIKMEIPEMHAIEALGNLLNYYNSDLKYISCFHMFKNGEIDKDEYICNNKSCFRRFLNEFKVARNVKKDRVEEFMLYSREWVLGKYPEDVDLFAKEIKKKGITQDGKVMTSLASKILFLNNPETIIPIDTLNKRGIGQKSNSYSEFKNKIDEFISEYEKEILEYLTSVDSMLTKIEVNSESKIEFKKYRIIRFVDKLLWTIGRAEM